MPKVSSLTSAAVAKPNAPSWKPRPNSWALGALLVAVVFAAYRPAAVGGFIWDDDDYVTLNPNLRSPAGLAEIWLHPTRSPQYYPLLFTTFWAQYHLWGAQPRGYHEVNILLHAINAILVWRLLRCLALPGAFLAAMLFALHPVMVESVAWITETKNTLSLLFYLASLLAWLHDAPIESDNDSHSPRRRPWLYLTSLALFIFALASKTVTATLPVALLLILWWKRRLHRRDVLPLIPFFAIAVIAATTTTLIERSHVGATGPQWSLNPLQRLLIASHALWFYAAKLLWPANLAFVYSKWPINPSHLLAWIYPATLLLLIGVLFALRTRFGRGPLTALLLYISTLAPALGLVNVYPMRYTFVADHYQYHASIALIALFASAATTLFTRSQWNNPLLRFASAATLSILFFVLTWQRAAIYQNPRTLWSDTTRKSPDSWMAWLNLGQALRLPPAPDLSSAATAYDRALQLARDVSDTHLGLAQLYIDQQRYPDALRELRQTLALEPAHAVACNLIGFCTLKTAGPAAAPPWFEKALAINPRYWPAQFNLALALKEQDQIAQAAAAFERAVQMDPASAEALFHLADCYRQLGKLDLAEQSLQKVIALQPHYAEAHFSLAGILRQLGRADEADFHRARALALKPSLRKLLSP